MPKWILANEEAMVSLDVATLFDTRLAVGDGYILEAHVVLLEQGALAPESLVFDQFHLELFYGPRSAPEYLTLLE